MTMSLYQLEKDGAVRDLLGYLEDDAPPVLRERAAAILGEVTLDADTEPMAIDRLVDRALHDERPQVRAVAIDTLDGIGATAVDALIAASPVFDDETGGDIETRYRNALRAAEPELRMAAAGRLGSIGSHAVLPPLIDAVEDSDYRVRVRVVRAIGTIGHDGGVPVLTRALADEAAPVRREAADALGRIGTDRSLAPLIAGIADDDDHVRYLAASGLGACDTPAPIDPLLDAVSDPSDVVREAACLSIIDLLATAPMERSDDIRSTVIAAIEPGNETMVRQLIAIVTAGRNEPVRRNAVWLLGHLVSDRYVGRSVEALIDVLREDDPHIVNLAATSLVEIGGSTVELRALSLASDNGVPVSVRTKALYIVGKTGTSRSIGDLDAIRLGAQDDAIAHQATVALANIDDSVTR